MKTLGQFFTPDYIVELILDDIEYTQGNILDKRIMEPSFGEGAFLIQIVERIIKEGKRIGLSKEEIKQQLQNNVYGIEIDKKLYSKTINSLNNVVASYGFNEIKWFLYCEDALDWNREILFDYVVGNPPYIRVHDLDKRNRDKIKKFNFSQGMKEMYVIFFELGINMLAEHGKLGYITPNSYMTNKSQSEFRKYLLENNLIKSIENFGSYKAFETVDTYTCITVLEKTRLNREVLYSSIKETKREYTNTYKIDEIKEPWNLTNKEDGEFLKQLEQRSAYIGNFVECQYGFATNCDRVYISKTIESVNDKVVLFNGTNIEKDLIKEIVKGSRYHGNNNYYILFPYYTDSSVIEEDEMRTKFPLAYSYFLSHKEELKKRDMENGVWYQFARSQGLSNCFKRKLVINNIIPADKKKIEIYELPESVFVYSGIFITADSDETLLFIKEKLETEEFVRYAKIRGKDMSGGYKSINAKIIKEFRI